MGDDVAATAVGVGSNRLPVAEGHDHQKGYHDDRDPHQVAETRLAASQQDEHARARRIRNRRHHVGREDRQGLPFRQTLGELRVGWQRRSEQSRADRGATPAPNGARGLGLELGFEVAGADVAEVTGVRTIDYDPAVPQFSTAERVLVSHWRRDSS